MANYNIQVASKLDSSDFAQIANAAFNVDPIGRCMKGTLSSAAIQAYQARRYQRDFARAGFEGVHYYKVVDESNGCVSKLYREKVVLKIFMVAEDFSHPSRKTVAFSKWQFPYTSTPQVEAEKAMFEKNTHENHPPGYNSDFYYHFSECLGQKSAKGIDKERYFTLHTLCVSPAHQRKGLGTLLIKHGLQFADGQTARTYIEANSNGLGLYKRFGWKEVDEIVFHMDDFGGNGIAIIRNMIREP